MLPLSTEVTTEALNVSTDRRHPFYTYDDHNLFRQFRFTQQNIIVNTDDVERDMGISNALEEIDPSFLSEVAQLCLFLRERNHPS